MCINQSNKNSSKGKEEKKKVRDRERKVVYTIPPTARSPLIRGIGRKKKSKKQQQKGRRRKKEEEKHARKKKKRESYSYMKSLQILKSPPRKETIKTIAR